MSFSTMYVGATGVKAHGTNMQVVGNNLANVSTIGYKKADGQFTDLISQQLATGGAQYDGGAYSFSQLGKGVALGEIRNIFMEGGLENTNEVTDLAITGEGFFGVRKVSGTGAASSGATHFTRAGSFRFNSDAYLVDPHDYRLQGYAIDRDTGEVSTSLSDVQFPYEDIVDDDGNTTRWVRSQPKVTTSVDMITTLDALTTDRYQSLTNPMFSLIEHYDATQDAATPFGDEAPAYSSSISVFDADGNERDMTVYFDPITASQLSNASPGYTYWEYLVAMPGEADGSAAYGTSGAGLAGMGVLVFNGQGELVNHAAFELQLSSGASGKNVGSWVPSSFDEDGVPQLNFNFGEDGSSVGETQSISYNFGINSSTASWDSNLPSNAGAVGFNAANLSVLDSVDRDVQATTSYDTGSATIYQNQDGYTWGYLQYTSVNREGVLSGFFSNGQTEDFYQVGVYRFNSEWGLRRDGSNNFVATSASGDPIAGTADSEGRGTIQQNTLEQSNVDMAEEFAKMILTQRGYQANTKVITTADTLLNTTISIKK